MASIFTKIINGEIACYKISESEKFFAFLDIMPLAEGHILVVPKNEIDYIFDLDSNELAQMMQFAQTIAVAQRKAIPCKRIGIAVIGLEVPHAHIHLIPLNSMSDINFSLPKLKLAAERMNDIAEKIKSEL